VSLALVGAMLVFACVGGVFAVWRLKRRKKVSRVASSEKDDDFENKNVVEPKQIVPKETELDSEVRRQAEELHRAEFLFQQLRSQALEGDHEARKDLLSRAKVSVNPCPQLVATVDELMLVMKKEKMQAMIKQQMNVNEVAIKDRNEKASQLAARALKNGSPTPVQISPPLPSLPSKQDQQNRMREIADAQRGSPPVPSVPSNQPSREDRIREIANTRAHQRGSPEQPRITPPSVSSEQSREERIREIARTRQMQRRSPAQPQITPRSTSSPQNVRSASEDRRVHDMPRH